jgi:hypothetical protein
MSNILKITKFHLLTLFKGQSYIFIATILLNILISVVVTHLVAPNNTNAIGGSTDPVALIWIFVLGIIFFSQGFKFMLSHGVSRKRVFIASSISLAVMAVIWSLLVTLFVTISRMFTNIIAIYELLYRNRAPVSMATWEFAALLLFAVLGWFIYLIYYISGRKTKYLITAAPFVLVPLLMLFNIMAEGKIFYAIGRFFINIMGFASSTPNPYIGALSMLVTAVIFCGAIFLLIRRAQIKDS